jgi:cytochrome c556
MLLIASLRLTVTRQGFMMEEMKDSMLKNIESFLDEEKARANREFAAIESSLEKLSLSIQHEFNEDSKRSLQQLLREMQEQRASNKVFRITCEQALLKTKNVHDGIEQEIKNTKADKNSKAVAGIMNASGKVQNVKQNLSDTIATDGSLAAAGIIHDVDLSISSSKDE